MLSIDRIISLNEKTFYYFYFKFQNPKNVKKLTALVFTAILSVACSSNDKDTETWETQDHTITFGITASDDTRASQIDLSVSGNGLKISDNSYNNDHLPYTKVYENKAIASNTVFTLSYTDDTSATSETFEPYTVNLSIALDDEIISSKQMDVTEEGLKETVSYTLVFE